MKQMLRNIKIKLMFSSEYCIYDSVDLALASELIYLLKHVQLF